MKIYESAVRKPISTILLFVGVMVFGLFSLMNLAVDQYPEIEIPQISVITMYPGANAADIETNITRVLEDNLNTVENLKKMTSKSSDNFSMITLEFEYGSDLPEAANDIRDAVSRTQSLLPDDVDYPTIFKFSSSMIPVMMLAVTADESYPALNKILDDKLVNEFLDDCKRRVPFPRIIYFGDGMTDIPSMKLVKDRGGNAIAVYKPKSAHKEKAIKLLKDDRVNFALPADYSDGTAIDTVVKTILDKLATERNLDVLKKKEEEKKKCATCA